MPNPITQFVHNLALNDFSLRATLREAVIKDKALSGNDFLDVAGMKWKRNFLLH